jgi:hypothetical protein
LKSAVISTPIGAASASTSAKSQLDQLEERGYLDPNRRGERLDECDAIEMFLADALPKSR